MPQLDLRARLVLIALLVAVALTTVVASPAFAEVCGASGSTGC